ncbi:FeoA family protein [Candidatus Stoquefichus massiliensis]|uniref:FeoA family protein n=1 Tax=Candidatus Stoquefichus massiliensis TaxID=1470350 RepID=UPI0004BCA896|nr:FeoA family protein [Candidatus Stoquefichus massiliensis]
MPLIFAELNEENIVKKIGGNNETKHHLENLGFVPGSLVSVVTKNNGNIIVSVKDSRVAMSKELAKKIMI